MWSIIFFMDTYFVPYGGLKFFKYDTVFFYLNVLKFKFINTNKPEMFTVYMYIYIHILSYFMYCSSSCKWYYLKMYIIKKKPNLLKWYRNFVGICWKN